MRTIDDYVRPSNENPNDSIFSFSEFEMENRNGLETITVYVEAVRPSLLLADLNIEIEIDPDADGRSVRNSSLSLRPPEHDRLVELAFDDRSGAQ